MLKLLRSAIRTAPPGFSTRAIRDDRLHVWNLDQAQVADDDVEGIVFKWTTFGLLLRDTYTPDRVRERPQAARASDECL